MSHGVLKLLDNQVDMRGDIFTSYIICNCLNDLLRSKNSIDFASVPSDLC